MAECLKSAVLKVNGNQGASTGNFQILLVETFVERDRFAGTSYKAANWIRIGSTTGRSRQDRSHTLRVPVKDVYVCSLHGRFREELST
jgi:hypothetical protein